MKAQLINSSIYERHVLPEDFIPIRKRPMKVATNCRGRIRLRRRERSPPNMHVRSS